MDLGLFNSIISDEKRSFDYLLSRLNNIKCPSCRCKQYYVMSRKRIRCRRCRIDYNPLLDSKFSDITLSYSKWLTLIKLFELSVSAKSSSMQTKISYKTTLNVFHVIQRTILEEMTRGDKALKDKIESNKTYFGLGRKNRGASTAKILYSIKEMEWRYNNRGMDLSDMIIDYMLGVNRT